MLRPKKKKKYGCLQGMERTMVGSGRAMEGGGVGGNGGPRRRWEAGGSGA